MIGQAPSTAEAPAGNNVSVQAMGFAGFGGGLGLASDGQRSSVTGSLGYGRGGVVAFGEQPPADSFGVTASGRASLSLGRTGLSFGIDLDTNGQFSVQGLGSVGIGRASKQAGFQLSYDPINGWRVSTPDFDRLSVAAELNGRVSVTVPLDVDLSGLIRSLDPFTIDQLNVNEGKPLSENEIQGLAPAGVVVDFGPNPFGVPTAAEIADLAPPGTVVDFDPPELGAPAPTEAEIAAMAPPGTVVDFGTEFGPDDASATAPSEADIAGMAPDGIAVSFSDTTSLGESDSMGTDGETGPASEADTGVGSEASDSGIGSDSTDGSDSGAGSDSGGSSDSGGGSDSGSGSSPGGGLGSDGGF